VTRPDRPGSTGARFPSFSPFPLARSALVKQGLMGLIAVCEDAPASIPLPACHLRHGGCTTPSLASEPN
jgi:hypothetical protein